MFKPFKVLNCDYRTTTSEPTTIEPTTEPQTEPPTASSTTEPLSYYSFTWEGIKDIYIQSDGLMMKAISTGDTIRLSKVCNAEYKDYWDYDCDDYASKGLCASDVSQSYLLSFAQPSSEESYQTGLNCPQCGCTDSYIKPLTSLWHDNKG